MKILFSDATLLHGGAERVISILANELVQMGHEVEILLYYDRPVWYEIDKRVNIHNDEQVIGKANPIKHILYRHRVLKHTDADVVVSFLAPINMINIVASRFCKVPIIVADRNDPRKTPVNALLRKLRDFLYRFADGIVLQSKNNQAYFSKCVQRKSAVIYNPVDVGDYKGVALKTEKEDEIVAVGRLIEQKNPFMLLKAFYEIQKKYPTFKLTFYGEGNLADEIKAQAAKLGIADKVCVPGAVKDVFEHVKRAKLYVMTSQYEGMPNALIEAMCVGVPVISTRVSGAVDLIHDKINGRLVDCEDVNGLENAIAELLGDYDKAVKYATEGVALNEKLESQQITSDWIKFIEEIISKK